MSAGSSSWRSSTSPVRLFNVGSGQGVSVARPDRAARLDRRGAACRRARAADARRRAPAAVDRAGLVQSSEGARLVCIGPARGRGTRPVGGGECALSVSVLLPVYNGAGTLGQALDSILAQDLADFELLVVDDASTDARPPSSASTPSGTIGSRPCCTKQRRSRGDAEPGCAGPHADESSRGYEDDEALPARLRLQQAFLADTRGSSPPGATSCSWAASAARPTRRTPLHAAEIARVLVRENCLYHPSVVMRRTEVLPAGGYRGEFKNAEDYELWLRLARIHDFANVPQALSTLQVLARRNDPRPQVGAAVLRPSRPGNESDCQGHL